LLFRLLVDAPRLFVRHFRAYRKYTGRHLFVLTGLNLVMSWTEGIGLALFYPLLRSDQGDTDALSSAFKSILSTLDVEPTPLAVLPLIIAVFVAKGLLMQVTYSYQSWLAARIPYKLRLEIIGNLRRIDYRALDSTNTGFVSNLLVNEVARAQSGFVSFVRTFPPTLNIIVFFAIVLWLDWYLTVLCGLMALSAIALVGITGRIAATASASVTKENAILTSLLIQLVQAFRYLRATAGFGELAKQVERSADRVSRADYRANAAAALALSLAQPMMVVFLAGIIYYQTGIQGQPIGSLFVLLLYFFRIMTELWALQANWQSFMGNLGPIDLVYSTIDRYAANREANGTRAFLPGAAEKIVLDRVGFSYVPGREVLREIDLEIAKNSTIAFVGESGSGKSTLVDLILGTLKPTRGEIRLDGIRLAELDLETLRAHVGYVPQDAMLFDDTVANNISLWKPTTVRELRDVAARARAADFIEAMTEQYDTQIGDRGIKLSGGQRQRIAIARELFKNPSILVLDEATSALDTESERAIQNSIESLAGQMTILIIAHRLSTIRNCKQICVLHDGRIVETGSYDELLARPGSRFQRLVQLQELGGEE
jgi:subfamily B ATP-binding cassette protein MsbA